VFHVIVFSGFFENVNVNSLKLHLGTIQILKIETKSLLRRMSYSSKVVVFDSAHAYSIEWPLTATNLVHYRC